MITAVIYALAASTGIAVYQLIRADAVIRILAADASATLFVYFVSLTLGNASVYDPYWSVAPMVILPMATSDFGVWNPGTAMLTICIFFWGLRLTANWAYTFHGYARQDWRYSMLREKSGALYPLVCLFGIMLFPTLVVFLCLLPAFRYIQTGGVNFFTGLGFAVCLSAATLQMVADTQLHRFQYRAKSHGEIIRCGVWRYSRHPNYLGEILMWWGVFLVMLSVSPGCWALGFGALVNTLMFLFVSIPMAEKRLAEYKVGFSEYVEQTNMLLPFALRHGR